MKKLILVLGIAVIAMSTFFNTATMNNSNGDLDLASLLAVSHAASEQSGGDSECTSGGPGASSCTYSAAILGVVQECSVTCDAGYYACCYLQSNTEAKCKCKTS